jgi:glycosyltransferase involved in cell wall biosynthesis
MLLKPLVSILLPIYNYSNFRPVVNSILKQDYNNFELLICDDGSNPPLQHFDFQDKRVKFIRNKINMGLGKTLNNLLIQADKNAKYFSTIEQDDIYRSYFISDCIKFLEKNIEFGLVSGISEFWDGSRVTYKFPGMIAGGNDYPFGEEMFLLNYRRQIKVAQTCMVIRKKVHYENRLMFSEKYESLSVDWDYILRFSLVSKIKGIQRVFVRQDRRKQRNSLTTKNKKAGKIVRDLLKDFKIEFSDIISEKDYNYAIATQYYTELGNYKFLKRISLMIFKILFLDPDKTRVKARFKKEILNKIIL